MCSIISSMSLTLVLSPLALRVAMDSVGGASPCRSSPRCEFACDASVAFVVCWMSGRKACCALSSFGCRSCRSVCSFPGVWFPSCRCCCPPSGPIGLKYWSIVLCSPCRSCVLRLFFLGGPSVSRWVVLVLSCGLLLCSDLFCCTSLTDNLFFYFWSPSIIWKTSRRTSNSVRDVTR